MKLLTMMALGAMAIGCDDSAQKGEPSEPDAQLETCLLYTSDAADE